MAPLPGARWAPVAVMPVVCLLVAAGMSSPNPFSLGLSAKNYDPGRPGIVGVTRHPVIWGMALWAASHLLANTDAAGALLFGLLLALGLTGPLSLDRKRRKTLGDEAWRRLRADTGRTSMGRALVQTGVWRWLAAAALYAALLGAHEAVIGVSAFPA